MSAPPPVYVLGTGPWYAQCQGCGWESRSRYTLDGAVDDQVEHRCPEPACPECGGRDNDHNPFCPGADDLPAVAVPADRGEITPEMIEAAAWTVWHHDEDDAGLVRIYAQNWDDLPDRLKSRWRATMAAALRAALGEPS